MGGWKIWLRGGGAAGDGWGRGPSLGWLLRGLRAEVNYREGKRRKRERGEREERKQCVRPGPAPPRYPLPSWLTTLPLWDSVLHLSGKGAGQVGSKVSSTPWYGLGADQTGSALGLWRPQALNNWVVGFLAMFKPKGLSCSPTPQFQGSQAQNVLKRAVGSTSFPVSKNLNRNCPQPGKVQTKHQGLGSR